MESYFESFIRNGARVGIEIVAKIIGVEIAINIILPSVCRKWAYTHTYMYVFPTIVNNVGAARYLGKNCVYTRLTYIAAPFIFPVQTLYAIVIVTPCTTLHCMYTYLDQPVGLCWPIQLCQWTHMSMNSIQDTQVTQICSREYNASESQTYLNVLD